VRFGNGTVVSHRRAFVGSATSTSDLPVLQGHRPAAAKIKVFFCALSDDLRPALKRISFHHLHSFDEEINLI
jgi:hypothetical protein